MNYRGKSWLIFLLLYLAFYLKRLHNHLFWRDEAQAWLIAKESNSLGSLMDSLRFEGHPPIWYLLLKITHHAIPSVESMKILIALVSLSTFFLLSKSRLFSRTDLSLILLGFLMISGYTIISRPYLLGFLFTLIAVLQSKKNTYPIITCLFLSLAILTHLLFIPLSLMLAISILFLRRKTKKNGRHYSFARDASFMLVPFGVSGFALLTNLPGSEHQFQLSHPKIDIEALHRISQGLLQTFIPFFSNIDDQENLQIAAFRVVGVLYVFILLVFSFRNEQLILLPYLVFAFLLSANFAWGYGRLWWHTGVGFLGFLAFLSLSRIWIPKNQVNLGKTRIRFGYTKLSVLLLLTLQLTGNFNYVGRSLLLDTPYSNAKLVAMYLKDNCNSECSLYSETDNTVAAVSAYMDGRKIKFLGSGREGTFTIWSTNQAHSLTQEKFEESLQALGKGFLITSKETFLSSSRLTLVMETSGAVWKDEDFRVYRIRNSDLLASEAMR